VAKLDIHEISSSRRLVPGPDGDALEVAGLVKLSPPEAAAADLELSINGAPFAAATTPARLSERGLYTLHYRKRGASAVSTVKVRVLKLKVELSAPPAPLAVGGPGGPMTLSLSDERGRPSALPGLSVTAYPGGALTLAQDGPGRHTATVPSPQKYVAKNSVLITRWAAGELRRDRVAVAAPPRPPAPPPPPKPAPYRWHDAPVALESVRKGPGLPARSARPMTGLGTSVFVSQADFTEDIHMRLAFRGEIALLDGDLGFDLDLPVMLVNATLDGANDSDFGDIRVGARYLALDRWGLALSPSLRVTAPSGGYARNRFGTLLEPGLLLEWTWRELLTIGTNQVFIADLAPDFDAALHYAGTYGASVRLGRFSIAAELDTVFGIQEPGLDELTTAVGLGGALRVHLDRARIGLAGGAGLNDDGQRLMGRFSVGLTADLGFDWP